MWWPPGWTRYSFGLGGVVEDGDLVARARAGDPVAFERLFETYHAPILNYLHRMVDDRALAEDLTQDAFVKAYRALPTTQPDLAFRAWLYRIATNTAISHLHRKKLVKWVPFLAGQEHATDQAIDRPVGRKYDVEQTLEKLPQHYASALLLRHYQGLSLAETADALGITENAAKLRLFRARKAFAAAYGDPRGDGSTVNGEGQLPAPHERIAAHLVDENVLMQRSTIVLVSGVISDEESNYLPDLAPDAGIASLKAGGLTVSS